MRSLKRFSAFFLTAAVIATIIGPAAAQTAVPMLINYQGELRSPTTGEPVPDGAYNMVFRIYDVVSGSVPLWQGVHSDVNGNPVQVTNGIFSVILGSGPGNVMDASVFNGAERWLEIRVGMETLSPRQRITSVAYSLVSQNSRLLGGNEPSDFVIQAQGLRLETNDTSPNIIAGYGGNAVTAGAVGATIAGGGLSGNTNSVTDSYGTISGGRNNQAGDNAGTTDDAWYATVGGGVGNIARGSYATVSGGTSNNATGSFSTVSGGYGNAATANYATIAGGGRSVSSDINTGNRVTDNYGTVGGGGNNQAGDNAGTTDDAFYATVGGGKSNQASGQYATVSGGWSNGAGNVYTTVGGGYSNNASANSATISGGYNSSASANCATVGGGYGNNASSDSTTIGGGRSNTASGSYATVGGGYSNQATSDYATISGGGRSDPANSGTGNRVTDNYGTVGGGGDNQAGDNAGATTDAPYATVGGGRANAASGPYAAVGGGDDNTASQSYATVAGGTANTAQGSYSFAAGRRAKANHNGCFAWGDSYNGDVASSGNNQFVARASGGVWFYSNTALTAGVRLSAGASSWSSVSDRGLKRNIRQVDGREILSKLTQIPISRWSYKAQDPAIEHMGPMAQDFYAAFGLGEDDKYISTVDADGVALAAIQGLHQIVEEKDARIVTLEKQNAELQERLSALENLVEKLAEKVGGEE